MSDLLGFDLTERGMFSSWEDALRRLIDRVEGIGVLVMVSGIVGVNTHRKLNPDEFRGFALSDPLVPLIFVNGSDTKAAQIFTMSHELAHIWLGASALSDAAMTAEEGVTEELWFNQVAAEVLVPLSTLRSDYRGESSTENFYYTQPIRLSRQFAQAVIVSAFEGSTTYRDAYRLLGTKKHSTFENLAAELGVA